MTDTRPFVFQWHITDLCNLRCRHCYQTRFDASSHLAKKDLLKLFEKISVAIPTRPLGINLTGGEPCLYSELGDLLEELHEFSNLQEISLITNGTRIDQKLFAKIVSLDKLKFIKISVESFDPEINDRIRGAGNLALVKQNIHRLKDMSNKPIVLMVTLARYNLGTIASLVEQARSLGVFGVLFERFIPLGRGTEQMQQMLDEMDWYTAVKTIFRLAQFSDNPTCWHRNRAFWLTWEKPPRLEIKGATCNLGDESMALMPNGTVFPCRRLPVIVGNLKTEPFEVILERLSEFQPSKLARRLIGGQCKTCSVQNCLGCRAASYAVSHKLEEDDPQCFYFLLEHQP